MIRHQQVRVTPVPLQEGQDSSVQDCPTYNERYEGFINESLANTLSRMARFRNLLVHGYSRVDDLRVLTLVKERLVDIIEFIKEIQKASG